MKPKPRHHAACLLLVAATGCTTVYHGDAPPNRHQARLAAHQATLAQPRSIDTITMRGTNLTWTIRGATEVTFAQAVPPMPGLERDPTLAETITGVLGTIAPWAALGYISRATRPQRPTVVEQPPAQLIEPVIVEPVFAP